MGPERARGWSASWFLMMVAAGLAVACEEGAPPEPAHWTGGAAGPAPAADDERVEPIASDAGEPRGAVDLVEIVGPARASIPVGETLGLEAVAYDAEGEALALRPRWQSDDEHRVYVDGGGTLLGVAPGEATVRARVGDVVSAPVRVEVVDADPPSARFGAEVVPLLRARCATPGCHVDDVEPGDLRFDRRRERLHRELVDEEAEAFASMDRVLPGDPRASYLFLKITLSTPPAGARMPLGAPPLPAEDVGVVLRWILAGAPND